MLHDRHHLHDRVAWIERRLDQIAYGGVVGLVADVSGSRL
jgi:hypothetical protein